MDGLCRTRICTSRVGVRAVELIRIAEEIVNRFSRNRVSSRPASLCEITRGIAAIKRPFFRELGNTEAQPRQGHRVVGLASPAR